MTRAPGARPHTLHRTPPTPRIVKARTARRAPHAPTPRTVNEPMSLYDRQRSSVVALKGQGTPDHISRTPGQEVAQIEAELRTLGVRKGHKCPFCRLPVPDKLRWKTQGGGKDCPLMCRTA